ncbi:MAG: acetolactate synthase small subunit [Oscillospiraceae bacterium]|nr:acetolactate synthase small subunit [Oscillospiraceae bacterium]
MKSIFSVLVENKAGILARTAGLFARRGFNIESLAVGETADPLVSRMTIVVDGEQNIIGQVEKQLNKQIDVIKVRVLDAGDAVSREAALIKVKAEAEVRGQITDIAAIMKASIVDLSQTTATLEIIDTPERVRQLLGLLAPYGITEMARTGTVALLKGANALSI